MSSLKFSILVSIIVPILSVPWEPDNDVKYTVCKSPECENRGEYYLKNSDREKYPCNDFYEFACGNWGKVHPSPPYVSQWSVYNVMHRHSLQVLKEMLDGLLKKPANNEIAQLKLVYDTCLSIPSYTDKNPEAIGRKILKAGLLLGRPLWTVHNHILEIAGESPLFDISVLPSSRSGHVVILRFTELKSAFGSIIHEGDWKSSEETAYIEFANLLLKKLNLNLLKKDTIPAIFKFRKLLNAMARKSNNQFENLFEPKGINYFKNWLKHQVVGSDKSKLLQAPWDEIVKILLPSVQKNSKDREMIISICNKQYFSDLSSLLDKTPDNVIIGHMVLYFAERHTIYDSQMEALLKATNIESASLDDNTVIRSQPERWLQCIDNPKLYDIIGRVVLSEWFKQEHVDPVLGIVKGMMFEMGQQIRAATWMDSLTKLQTIDKIEKLEPWIGYPPWYTNKSIPARAPIGYNLIPNALYSEARKVISIRGSLLKNPMFNADLPPLYNIGALGFIIGHELHHTIQNCGTYTFKQHVTKFWPSEMRKKCYERRQCFIDEYNRITTDTFKTKYHIEPHVDTRYSFVENFPDVMGLKTAYRLYKRFLRTNPQYCQVLPQFSKYSCDQMFFISFANTMCNSISQNAALSRLQTSVHSINHVRVNAAVSMNEDFVAAFKCPKSSKMNSNIKCDIWK